MKLSTLIYFVAIIFFSSCKKNSIDETDHNFRIEVIAGNNQSDTIGQVLADSVKIRALMGNYAFPKAKIKVVQPGCAYTKEDILLTNNDGIVSFSWQLNGGIGDQALKLFLLDSLNNVLDSAIAEAKGLFFERCWLPADCIPVSASPQSIVELADGTILSGLGKLYRSNNNGYAWHPHQTYPNQFLTYKVVTYGRHVVTLNNTNIQHSSDNGQTWVSASNLQGSTLDITNTGKLFLSTISGVYMSTDFGQNWTNISTIAHGLGYSAYYLDFCELTNGRIYAVNDRHELWISPDGGNTWTSSFVNDNVSAFVDNDDVYIGKNGLNQGELYRMKKNETSWTLICSFPNIGSQAANITHISKVNDSFYFLVSGYGLIKTPDFISFQNLRPYPIETYLITKSNTAIVAGAGFNIGQIVYNTNP